MNDSVFSALDAKERCQAVVYKKDTYRRTGGKRHFEMHYRRERCSRPVKEDGLCWQHAGTGVLRV